MSNEEVVGRARRFALRADAPSYVPRGSTLRAYASSYVPRGSTLRADAPSYIPRGSTLRADAPSYVPCGSTVRADAPSYVPCDSTLGADAPSYIPRGPTLRADASSFIPHGSVPRGSALRADATVFVPQGVGISILGMRPGLKHTTAPMDSEGSSSTEQTPPPVAHNVNNYSGITSGNTIYNVAGDLQNLLPAESGMQKLSRYHVPEAVFDSEAGYLDHACVEGIWKNVLHRLRAWAQRPEDCAIYPVIAPLGMGKTTIARTFAHSCQEDLGASFFFKHDDPERGKGNFLFLSLAFQLAHSVPTLRPHIENAVERGKYHLATKSIEDQFRELLVLPFQQVPECTPRPIVVIDGLDQCAERGVQVRILKLILEASRTSLEGRVPSKSVPFPVRFVFFCRPETHLVDEFEAYKSRGICNGLLELRATNETLRSFYRKRFAEIETRARRCGQDLGDYPWPGAATIRRLTCMTRGSFLFATTILAFIDDKNCHPEQRLEEVLDFEAEATAALDIQYEQIMRSFKHSRSFLHILFAAIPPLGLNPEDIDLLFDLNPGEARAALEGLSSVLDLPPIRPIGLRQGVFPHDTTFPKYLCDPERSKGFCVYTSEICLEFSCRAVAILSGPPTLIRHSDNFLQKIFAGVMEVVAWDIPCVLPLFCNPQFHLSFSLSTRAGYIPGPLSSLLCSLQQRQPTEYSALSDLIGAVEDFQLICYINEQLWSRSGMVVNIKDPSPLDATYTAILTQYPKVLLYLRTAIAWRIILGIDGECPSLALEHLGLTWDDLRPLCCLRNSFNIPDPTQERFPEILFPPGQSPLEFLSDPQRAGKLYKESEVLREQAAINMISFTKLLFQSYHARPLVVLGPYWGETIVGCRRSQAVLRLISNFDVTPCCKYGHQESFGHFMDHVWWHADLDLILAWLEDFEERPVDAIKWWEQQKAAALQCFRSLPMSEDGEWDPEFKINPVEDLIQRPTYETMWVMGEESESEEWMDLDDDDGGRSDVDGESAPELYDDSMDLSDADGESTPELYDDSMDISDADPEYTSELGLMDLDDEGRLMNHCYGHPYPFSSSDIGLPCLRSSPTRV